MYGEQVKPIEIVSGEDVTPRKNETNLKNSDLPISASTEQPRSGVSSNPIKNRVDEKNRNSYMLSPRNLSITWSDDANYWSWVPIKDANETVVEAAQLNNVCWLDISGKFDTKNLTPGKTYEVVYKVKLEDPAYGWETPVNLKLVFPNSNEKTQVKKVNLRELPRHQWVDISVGEFVPDTTTGVITFSVYEHEAGVWKKGLVLKGVEIRPKFNN